MHMISPTHFQVGSKMSWWWRSAIGHLLSVAVVTLCLLGLCASPWGTTGVAMGQRKTSLRYSLGEGFESAAPPLQDVLRAKGSSPYSLTHELGPGIGDVGTHNSMHETVKTSSSLLQSRQSVRQVLESDAVLQCPEYILTDKELARRYYVAVNLHNSEHILPNMIAQLYLLALQLPPDHLFISIYESGSSDKSAQWLTILDDALSEIGMPHNVSIDGDITRAKGQERIEFLADVRNAALDNLPTVWPSSKAQSAMTEDFIVYINDVFFCFSDILRLTHHGADVACGMDFDAPQSGFMKLARRMSAISISARNHLSERLRAKTKPGSMKQPLAFYDVWVARDVTGQRFLKQPPYVAHNVSAQQLSAGLPIPVYSCWNGMVAFKAKPFKSGLRFRDHGVHECKASECSLLADDLHHMGYHDMVVDPMVRVAYEFDIAVRLYEDAEGLPSSRAPTLSSSSARVPATGTPAHVHCCPSSPGGNSVDFSKCFLEPR